MTKEEYKEFLLIGVILNKCDPDIIYGHNFHCEVYGALKSAGISFQNFLIASMENLVDTTKHTKAGETNGEGIL